MKTAIVWLLAVLTVLAMACTNTFEGIRPERPAVWVSAPRQYSLALPEGMLFAGIVFVPYRLEMKAVDGSLAAHLSVVDAEGPDDCPALLDTLIAGREVAGRGRMMIRGNEGAFATCRSGSAFEGLAVLTAGKNVYRFTVTGGTAADVERVLQDLLAALRTER